MSAVPGGGPRSHDGSSHGRPVGRSLVSLAIVLLAIVAAGRLSISWRDEAGAPELGVRLALPTTTDPDDVARRWVVPLESLARGLGRVETILGEVGADGASLRVLLEPGTDARTKAARLLSELPRLRRRLPEGSTLTAWPASAAGGSAGRDEMALVTLDGPDAASRAREIADRIEALPGVRAVETWGVARERVTVSARTDSAEATAGLAEALERRRRTAWLGARERSGRLTAVVSDRGAGLLQRAPVRVGRAAVPLRALADVGVAHEDPGAVVRFRGRPGLALSVEREDAASPLAVDRAVRALVDRLDAESPERLRARVFRSEAEPLRRLLSRLGVGFALALLATALAGFAVAGGGGALQLPAALGVALAVAVNLAWLTRLPLDAATLPALALGLVACVPASAARMTSRSRRRSPARSHAARRLGTAPTLAVDAVLALSLVPVAVVLASDTLRALMGAPSRALLVAAAGALVGALLPPATVSPRPRSRRAGRLLRGVLRDPVTVLLAAAVVAHVVLSLFGSALDPRDRGAAADRSRLVLSLALPSGASLEETLDVVSQAESHVAAAPGVRSFWSQVRPGRAFTVLEVAAEHRRPDRLGRLKTLLQHRVPEGAAAVRVREPAAVSAPGLALEEAVGARPSTDESAAGYRVVLRGPDASVLRRTGERARRLVLRHEHRLGFRTDWGRPDTALELRPRPGLTTAARRALERRLVERTLPPRATTLPGRPEREVVLASVGSPEDADDVPTRRELMQAPLRTTDGVVVPAALVDVVERAHHAAVPRHDGRFVMTMTVTFPFQSQDLRETYRERIDRSLALMDLPPGVSLERPPLEPSSWGPARLRLLGLALLLPALSFAAAAIRLDGLVAAALALLPSSLGVIAVSPFVAATGLGMDAATLLLAGAAACATLPLSLSVVAGSLATAAGAGALPREQRRPRPRPALTVHRTARRLLPVAVTTIAVGLALLVGATRSLGAAEEPWVLPLRAAAVVLALGAAASVTVLPAALLGLLTLRRRDAEQVRRLRNPPEWGAASTVPTRPLTLSARSLVKVYPNGKTALSGVSFELEPSIVGLLGPNGAGKTTLMRILVGLLEPTRGEVRHRGVPVVSESLSSYRRLVGFLPQEFNAYPGLTGRQFLDYWALELGIDDLRTRREEIDRLLHVVGLGADADRVVRDYSGGMRKRVGIARALLGEPPVLVVDEPTTGLDIESRQRFREVLLRAASRRIVILSTHLAGDVEATASRLLLLHDGRLRFDGAPSELVERARGRVFETEVSERDLLELSLRHRLTARVRVVSGVRVRGVVAPGEELPGRAAEPALEEAYLAEVDRHATRERGASGEFAFLEEWRREDGA